MSNQKIKSQKKKLQQNPRFWIYIVDGREKCEKFLKYVLHYIKSKSDHSYKTSCKLIKLKWIENG